MRRDVLAKRAWRCLVVGAALCASVVARADIRISPDKVRLSGDVGDPDATLTLENRRRQPLRIRRIDAPGSLRVSVSARAGVPGLYIPEIPQWRRLPPEGLLVGPSSSASIRVGLRWKTTMRDEAIAIEVGDEGTPQTRTVRVPVTVSETAQCKTRNDICFIAFGDQGTADDKQESVANSMRTFHVKNRTDFLLGLGDNFYGTDPALKTGPRHCNDKRFETMFGTMYRGINGPFYMTLGNHDVHGTAKAEAQLCYARKNKKFVMPRTYYNFRRGPVEFFALFTPELALFPHHPGPQLKWRRGGEGLVAGPEEIGAVVVAAITRPVAVRRILEHLGLPLAIRSSVSGPESCAGS